MRIRFILGGAVLAGLIASVPVATQAITGVLCIKTTGKGTVKVRNPACTATEVQVGTFDTTAPEASFTETVEDISVRASTPSAVSIMSNPSASTSMPFSAGSEAYDTASLHDETTNPERLTVSTPGKYYIYGWVSFFSSAGGSVRTARLSLNNTSNLAASSAPANSAGVNTHVSVSTHAELAAGDFVTLQVLQDSGAPLGAVATFGMVKVP